MRRALLVVGWSAVVLAAAALVVAVIGTAFLRTRTGGEMLRRFAVDRVNREIAGHLDVGQLAFGGDWVVLRDVALLDPDGRPVLRAARVEVRVRLSALIGRTLDVRRLEVTRPVVTLRSNARGSNLDRALSARHQAPPAAAPVAKGPAAAPRRWLRVVELGHVRVTEGGLDWRGLPAGVIGIEDVRLGGHGRWETGAPALSGAFRIEARGRDPIDGALSADGDLEWEGDRGSASLRIDGVAGRLAAAVALEPTRRGPGLRVEMHGRELDVSAWQRGAPASDLAFDLDASLSGHGLHDVSGEVELLVPPSRLGGQRAGPVRLRAVADDGAVTLRELHVALPGLLLDGAGRMDRTDLHVRGRLSLQGLRATVRSVLGRRAALRLPVDAAGQVSFRAEGPRRGPSLHGEARRVRLSWAGGRADGLTAVLDLPSLARPQDLTGAARVAAVHIGERRIGGIVGRATTAGRQVRARLEIATPQPLVADASGSWRPGRRVLDVRRLILALPGGRWEATAPFPVGVGPSAFELGPVRLASGTQALDLSVARAGRRIRADGRATNLRLEELPRIVFGGGPRPRGTLNALVRVRGTVRAPLADASATIAGGALGPVSDATVRLDARLAGGRAAGTLAVAAAGAALDARFDLHAGWPWTASTPVDVAVSLTDLDLARAARLAGRDASGWKGRVRGEVVVHGTAGAPRFVVGLDGGGLALGGQPLGDASLTATGAPRVPLVASLRARILGRPSALDVAIDRGTDELVTAGAWDTAVTAPWHVRAEIDRLPLASLAALAGVAGPVGGTASLKGRLEGTVSAPAGEAVLTLDGVSGPGVPATDARFEMSFGDRVRGDILVVRRGERLVGGTISLDLPSTRLSDAAAVYQAPLHAALQLGPVRVRRMQPALRAGLPVSRVLQGRAQAVLDVSGTPSDPRARLEAAGIDFRLDEAPIGDLRLFASYRGRRLHSTLEVLPPDGAQPTLRVAAGASIDLSLGALRAGLRPSSIPISARLDARRFDVVWMSGLVDGVREVSGRLDAQLTARGPLGGPELAGHVRWQNGTALLQGLGSYRDVSLDAALVADGLKIERLSAASGDGRASISGTVRREALGLWKLAARASLERFPIYIQGQRAAIVSVDGRAEASVTERRVQGRASLAEAHVELESSPRKDLQDLTPAPDVVLVREGRPVDVVQARRLRRLQHTPEPALEAGEPPETGPPRIAVQLDARRNIWVRGDDLDLELGFEPGFRVERNGETLVFGQLDILRGTLNVFGRRLDVQSPSTLRFAGSPSNPAFDLTARYVAKSQGVVVTLILRGQGDDVTLSLTSTPPHSESELYALLITGRLGYSRGPSSSPSSPASAAAGRAASFAGSLIASELQKTLRSKLPLDVLTIESGDGGVAGSRLEAGSYVTRNLYLGYVGRVGTDPLLRYQNRNAVHLEYQLTEAWSFQGEYGDAGAGSLDLVWTKRY